MTPLGVGGLKGCETTCPPYRAWVGGWHDGVDNHITYCWYIRCGLLDALPEVARDLQDK